MKFSLKSFVLVLVAGVVSLTAFADEKPDAALAAVKALRNDRNMSGALALAKVEAKKYDPAKVSLTDAPAWVELFTLAQDYKGTRTVAARWAAQAVGEDKYKAQLAVLTSDYRLKDFPGAADQLAEMQPPTHTEAMRLISQSGAIITSALRETNLPVAMKILARSEELVPKADFKNDRERDEAKRALDSLAQTRKAIEENPGKEAEAVMKQRAAMLPGLLGGRLGGGNTNAAAARADAAAKRDEKLGKFLGIGAPDFKATHTHGSFKSLGDLNGKVVVLDFFAHWCGPCIAALPSLRTMYDDLKPKGLEVVGVTRFYGYYKTENKTAKDMPVETEFARMKDFMEEKKINWPVAFVGKDVFEAYGCTAIPHVVVIDKRGKIRKVKVGYDAKGMEAFREELESLLKL